MTLKEGLELAGIILALTVICGLPWFILSREMDVTEEVDEEVNVRIREYEHGRRRS